MWWMLLPSVESIWQTYPSLRGVYVCVCVCVCVCVYLYSVYHDGTLSCGWVCPLYIYRQALITKLAKAVNKLGKVQLK